MSTARRGVGHPLIFALLVIFLALGVGVLVVDPQSRAGRSVQLLWGAVPVSVAIWQYCYTRVERHRLWVNRTSLWLTNREMNWGVDVEYDVSDEAAALGEAERAIRALMGAGDSVLSQTDDCLVVQLRGLTVRARTDRYHGPDEEEEGQLKVDVPLAARGFRAWRRAVDDTVPTVLERIEAAIDSKEQKYVARIRFDDGNPYYGLFVASVPETSLLRFDIEYVERRPSESDVIRVHKNQVQIVSTSLQAARRQSLHYLGLQPIGASA